MLGMRLSLLALAAFLPAADAAAAPTSCPLQVVATTTLVADLVRQVAGPRAEVSTLMGPGVDPHLFKPVASDVLRLQRADVVFAHGLRLEGKMSDLLARLAEAGRRVHLVAESLPPERLLRSDGQPDPHVWFDVLLWRDCVAAVERGLAAADPGHAAAYAQRARDLRAQLEELHAWSRARAAELPAERRVLVTSHDAFHYFGRAYGFEVAGLQGMSTVGEAGVADVTRLADFVRARGLRAIFVETSVAPDALRRVAEDAGARIGGDLFSDALGAPGELVGGHDVGTYGGMIRHNLTTIVEALK